MAHAGWREAIRREAEGLYKNDTFELVKFDPKVMKLVRARWVFAVKDSGKLKARLVAKGFSQRSGIDFDVDGTAAGTVSPIATRLLLVMSFCLRFVIGTCDTCQAFLISSLEPG